MYNSRNQPPKEVYNQINISEYVKLCLMELSHIEGRRAKINTYPEAQRIKILMNDPQSILFKVLSDLELGFPCRSVHKVMCYPSNLGTNKGYVFFFICAGCGQRKKYLYVYNYVRPLLCRQCCRLPYRQINFKERKLCQSQNLRPRC